MAVEHHAPRLTPGVEAVEEAIHLAKSVIRQLATCRWVEEHQNVVVTGMTGTGKTYVACALAQQACRKGFRAVYRRATRLTDELTLAHADGTRRSDDGRRDCDRVLHNAHRIVLKGPSRRKEDAAATK